MPDPAPASTPFISVCICTYNGAERIGYVLEALGRQTDQSDRWDILVVDNASGDATCEVVRRGIEAHLSRRARLVREEHPGVMYARRKAAQEARGPVIAFLDDDNVPAPDYLERLLAVWPLYPRAAVMGGKVKPQWIGTPTPLGEAVAPFALALCDRGDEPFAYQDVTGGPAGAGMVVSRDLMRQIFREEDLAGAVTGRTGTGLTGGEDTAIVIRAHQLGFECRYEPSLVLFHRIPASRTSPDYLLRLYEGIGRGQASMRRLYDPRMKSTALAVLIALKEGLRWLSGYVRGPGATVRREYGERARDVHRLQRRQTYGRFRQGLSEALRRGGTRVTACVGGTRRS